MSVKIFSVILHEPSFEALVVICLWHTFPEPAQILGIKTTYSNLQGDVTSKLLTGYPNVEKQNIHDVQSTTLTLNTFYCLSVVNDIHKDKKC